MKTGKWHDGSDIPKKTGWYLRDYRNPPKTTVGTIPPFSVDYFDAGYWYVIDTGIPATSLCDAWFESLPWCKIKNKID